MKLQFGSLLVLDCRIETTCPPGHFISCVRGISPESMIHNTDVTLE